MCVLTLYSPVLVTRVGALLKQTVVMALLIVSKVPMKKGAIVNKWAGDFFSVTAYKRFKKVTSIKSNYSLQMLIG